MARRVRAAEHGFTLVEVLIVSALFLVVLTATVTTFTGFERMNRDNNRTNDQVERTRRAVERGMKQLRNLASRTTISATIDKATPYDFVFQTSDPTRTWVRYCTQDLGAGQHRLWSLANGAAGEAPASTSCPGSPTEWPQRDPVASNVTNAALSRTIPMFTYGRNGAGSITSVHMDVLLDDNLTRAPAEARVSSGVFLRNQNEFPVARFTSGPAAQARQAVLNASSSTDPEGRTLRYFWFRGTHPTFACGTPPPATTVLGNSVTLAYTFPPADGASGTRVDFTLVVCDPGDLQHFVKQPVTIP